jgi:uncharacterized membrane protein (DUF4010 family)
MTADDILPRLALALAIGLLLGLERGWHGREAGEGNRIAGIRTFALAGLFGGISGWLGTQTSPLFPALALVALGGLLAVGYRARLRETADIGLTTEVALLLAFALGTLAALGGMVPATAVAVIASLLLSAKPLLHRWLRHIRRFELQALFKLALISAVILPGLPDRGYGPGAVLNPRELWLAVVIVAGLSFAGYVAIRLAGARAGLLATGLFGGLASSTSTSLVLARVARGDDALAAVAATGIVVAGSVTFLRILALVAVFAPALIAPLALPMAMMAAAGLAGAALLHARAAPTARLAKPVDGPGNPLELTAALGFGAVLAGVLVAVHYLGTWLGTGGVHVAAALSGVTDVDALTISVSRLVAGDFAARDGAIAITIAAMVNTAIKGGIARLAGTAPLGRRVIAVYAGVIAAGAAGLGIGGWA